jgi:transcriptional regulator with XRE-family HTH domain
VRFRGIRDWSPGVQFRYWREAAGMYMQEAADQLNVSQQTVSAWETDVSLPRWRVADVIDKVYDLEPGMALAVIRGQVPPAGLVDAQAVGIDAKGELEWSARYLVRDVPAQRRFAAAS